ncbi:MAG: pentapeptide repeat-containing protein [Proteobacteria bacterium]|nr:pentapeptide repeat-containing protein [Pseudomonadota bacterium]
MPLLYDQKNLAPIGQQELDEMVKKHGAFLEARVGGSRAVLAYRNLSNLILRGVNLSSADFSGSLLFDCDFRGANLDAASFFAAVLQKSDFSNASLVRGDLRGANLRGTNFSGADMTMADLREGAIARKDRGGNISLMLQPLAAETENKKPAGGYFTEHVDAGDAVFADAKLSRAILRDVNLSNAVLEKADLSLAQLQGACLKDAVLRGADLTGAQTEGADLTGVLRDEFQGLRLEDEGRSLDDAVREHEEWLQSGGAKGKRLDLTRFDLRSEGPGACDFSGRNLAMMKARHGLFYRLRFTGAQLQAAELRDNDFRMARFLRADLRGADFSGSNLMRASLQLALLGPLKLPGGKAINASFSRCNLRFADLTGADLRGVNFSGADLTATDLRGADMEGSGMDGAITQGALMGV